MCTMQRTAITFIIYSAGSSVLSFFRFSVCGGLAFVSGGMVSFFWGNSVMRLGIHEYSFIHLIRLKL